MNQYYLCNIGAWWCSKVVLAHVHGMLYFICLCVHVCSDSQKKSTNQPTSQPANQSISYSINEQNVFIFLYWHSALLFSCSVVQKCNLNHHCIIEINKRFICLGILR